MEQYHLKHLFDQVNGIVKSYRKVSEITGENFNLLKILKLEASEVRMHSAFLAELLNPKGSHGQKDAFLKIFINNFCFKNNTICSEICKVEIEKHAGFISENGTEGGRIDILITDETNHNHIIIENKIYAGDQNHQLTRYYNYSKTADLIYLTLDGKHPSKGSIGELENDEHFKCYSYKYDIVTWLEQCRKEVPVSPIIRESITIYINLIKFLTNQTINHNMQEELADLLKSNLEAAFLIGDNLDNVCNRLLKDFTDELEKICSTLGLECTNSIDFDKNYKGFWIYKKEWKFLNIGFQFWHYDKGLIYGFVAKKGQFPVNLQLRNKLKPLPDNTPKTNDWWPWFRHIEEPYSDWGKFKAWQAISDGGMLALFIEKIEYLLKISKDIDL